MHRVVVVARDDHGVVDDRGHGFPQLSRTRTVTIYCGPRQGDGHAAAYDAGRSWRERDGRGLRCAGAAGVAAGEDARHGVVPGSAGRIRGSCSTGRTTSCWAAWRLEALRRELAYAEKTGVKELGPANYLAISGGGENGAYGAGLLTGWTALGTRPEFKGVTGVSTGALIAPFAFLGPGLRRGSSSASTPPSARSDVMTSRGLVSAMLGESLYDSTPLLHLIRGVLTPEMVAAIAPRIYREGPAAAGRHDQSRRAGRRAVEHRRRSPPADGRMRPS